MTHDIESAARVAVGPDLLDLAFDHFASSGDEDGYFDIAAAAFARWSGKALAAWDDTDDALVTALALRLEAFSGLIEAGEGPRFDAVDDEAWRRACSAAVASAELIESDGAPAFRIDDVLSRIRLRPLL